jgi:haloalkane dehalogenase
MDTRTTPDGLAYLRTPEGRFADLDGFPHDPAFVEVGGLRMAYVDVGPSDAQPLLLLHGEPTWSYLYRRMIPPLVEAGYRCIAPDLIGFGRSDKPVERDAYSYAGHIAWTQQFLDAAGLDDIVLFAQDWGGLIGLRLVAAQPDRFRAVAVGNTALPVGAGAGAGFDGWLAFSQSPAFGDVGVLMGRAVQARDLTDAEIDGYRAPFPDLDHMAGAVAFPALVPITPEHPQAAENIEAWRTLETFEKPFLTIWCPEDPVLGHLQGEFVERIAGAAGQPHRELRPGGHFIQDDRGEDVAAALVEWLAGLGI